MKANLESAFHNLDWRTSRADADDVADAIIDAVEREGARLGIVGLTDRAEAFKFVAKWLRA